MVWMEPLRQTSDVGLHWHMHCTEGEVDRIREYINIFIYINIFDVGGFMNLVKLFRIFVSDILSNAISLIIYNVQVKIKLGTTFIHSNINYLMRSDTIM